MTIQLTIEGRNHLGWTAATVTRSLETVAGVFDLTLSERDPGTTAPRRIRPGDACEVSVDGELVITGFVDTVDVRHDANSHEIGVRGRDATSDLVDCSAATKPGEWHNERLERIATALCQPFNIPVVRRVDTGAPFRRFRIEEGESVFEAIERACRFRGVLPLSDGAGSLVLGSPTRSRIGARLERGVNLLSASGTADWTNRYSDYILQGQQPGNDFLGAPQAAHVRATARDPGVDRHRPLIIIAEQSVDLDEAKARIQWEANVRAARTRSVSVAVQGFRDAPRGDLWSPGSLVHITDDWLGLDTELLISTTAHSISEQGSITRMTLYPEDAFVQRAEPEPTERRRTFLG